MDITLFIILFLIGIACFLISWFLNGQKELQIILAVVAWIVLVMAGISAFNLERTVYDEVSHTWETTGATHYEFVLLSFLFVVAQTMTAIVYILEYFKNYSSRNRARGQN